MENRSRYGLVFVSCVAALGCSAKSTSGGGTGVAGSFPTGVGGVSGPIGAGGNPVSSGMGGSGMPMGTAGVPVFKPPTAGAGGMSGLAGTGGMTASAGAGGMAAGGAGGKSGAGGAAAGGTGGGGSAGTLTGTLGALGAAKPVMAGWATTNGLETLIYLSSAPLSCAMMMTSGTKWLATLPAGTQVVEIVTSQPSTVKMYSIGSVFAGNAEVNFAEGSKSSSTEVLGSAGSVTFTKAVAMGAQEGTLAVTAPFTLSGPFHAEWCQGGTEY